MVVIMCEYFHFQKAKFNLENNSNRILKNF